MYGVFEVLSINGRQKEAEQNWRTFLQKEGAYNFQSCSGLVGQWWWSERVPNNEETSHGILPTLTNMFFAKVRFLPHQEDWWEHSPEIQWLEKEKIPSDEAKWTGADMPPTGPYIISRPLPIARIQEWVENLSTFPIAPMIRTRLRYGSRSICQWNEETDWCKFVFGTVKGGAGTTALNRGKPCNLVKKRVHWQTLVVITP